MRHLLTAVAFAAVPVAALAQAHRPPQTDTEIIINATSAAPPAVASNATIVTGFSGRVRTVRQGRNGWTCMPDNPATPTDDPMCLDANAMDWLRAWVDHRDAPRNHLGIIYMLQGGSVPSNEDPFATKPLNGRKWVTTGPRLMVVGLAGNLGGTAQAADAPMKPFLMWAGSSYEYVVIPVR